MLQDDGARLMAGAMLGNLGKDESVVREVIPKLFRTKADAEIVVGFLIAAANGGARQRTEKINQLLVKGLKPGRRDSAERKVLRKILFRWTWNVMAVTV